MTDLAKQFDAQRAHLRAVAYRLLGSMAEADDAVQEAWLRLMRVDTAELENLRAWLTTVVSRICLDALRARQAHREEPIEAAAPTAATGVGADPEAEAVLAESVGLALLVVLDRLEPAERLAFVLHDVFDVPFEEIAGLTGRTAAAARQLASRARRRVSGGGLPVRSTHTEVVAKFLQALKSRDMEAILAVLDPDLVVRADGHATGTGSPREVHGAQTWASQAVRFARTQRFAALATINGAAGAILAPRGRLERALVFTVTEGRISAIEIIAQPERLSALSISPPVRGH